MAHPTHRVARGTRSGPRRSVIRLPLARLLREGDELLEDPSSGGLLRVWWLLVLLTIVCAGVYGAVFGLWHGARLALYVAVKFPLVLLLTSSLTLPFNWITILLLGVPLRFLQVAALTFLTLAIASLVLASLAPVAWLFMLSAPPPTQGARTAHNLLYLMHTTFVGGAGLVGSRALRRSLDRVAGKRAAAAYWLWVASFAFVGGEVAWALRPFVGSVARRRRPPGA